MPLQHPNCKSPLHLCCLPEGIIQVMHQLNPDALVHVTHLLRAHCREAYCHGMLLLFCVDCHGRACINLIEGNSSSNAGLTVKQSDKACSTVWRGKHQYIPLPGWAAYAPLLHTQPGTTAELSKCLAVSRINAELLHVQCMWQPLS